MSKGMLHTGVETPEFRRAAKTSGIIARALGRIVDHLTRRPDAGELIPGTGGARKLGFRSRGHAWCEWRLRWQRRRDEGLHALAASHGDRRLARAAFIGGLFLAEIIL